MILTDLELRKQLQSLPNWQYQQSPSAHLARTFAFNSLSRGAAFAQQVAALADELNHHPDIELTYSGVTLKLCTHDAGGITQKDIDLARHIETIQDTIPFADGICTIASLREATEQFVTERDWIQFHSLKNLAAAISVESAELLEHFIWRERSEEKNLTQDERQAIAFEMVDVLLVVFAFANRLEVDVCATFHEKLEHNKKKYPIEKAKGRSDKYTKYADTKSSD